MKLRIKSNFSFGKLARKMPGIMQELSKGAGKGAATGIKQALEKDKYKDLEDSTIDIRRRGLSPSAGFMKTGSKKPLVHTGRLRDSIKQSKDGVQMNRYGQYQNDGIRSTSERSMIGGKTVPPRSFIDKGLLIETPEKKKALDDFYNNIKKAVRK